jgi:lysine 6-dehydrogenase
MPAKRKGKNPAEYILLIGAGGMGRAIGYDLGNVEPRFPLMVLDRDPEALTGLKKFVGGRRIRTVQGDAADLDLVRRLMSCAAVCIGALSYRTNLDHTAAAIYEGANWVDLGGNNDVVRRQFELDAKARAAGVSVIPDCGLAPGMVNVLAGDAMRRCGKISQMHIRVGGLPQTPKPPLFYSLVFSPEGLANEYSEPALVIEDGAPARAPPLTGWERLMVGPPFSALEAFHTSGGSSTLVETLNGQAEALDYKTIRYPGHLRKVKLLLDLGLFGTDDVRLPDGETVTPRQVMSALLERLGWTDNDLVIVKVWGLGHLLERREVDAAEVAVLAEVHGSTSSSQSSQKSASRV